MTLHHATNRYWTLEEDRLVQLYYKDHGPTWLQQNKLPNRSLTAISKRGVKLTGKTYKEHHGMSPAKPEGFNPIKLPPDTRDWFSRMMGDPLPGRSALDLRTND